MRARESDGRLRHAALEAVALERDTKVVHRSAAEPLHRAVEPSAASRALPATSVAGRLVPIGDMDSAAPPVTGRGVLGSDGASTAHLGGGDGNGVTAHRNLELLVSERWGDWAV